MNKEIHMFMDVPIYLKETKNSSYEELFSSGRKDGIRTHDLLVPNQAHYQAVLLPEFSVTMTNHLGQKESFDQFHLNH
jgi:hypothetical protein